MNSLIAKRTTGQIDAFDASSRHYIHPFIIGGSDIVNMYSIDNTFGMTRWSHLA